MPNIQFLPHTNYIQPSQRIVHERANKVAGGVFNVLLIFNTKYSTDTYQSRIRYTRMTITKAKTVYSKFY